MYILRKRSIFSLALFFGAGVITAYVFHMPDILMLICAAVLGIGAGVAWYFSKRISALGAVALIAFYLASGFAGCGYTAACIGSRPVFETVYDAEFSGKLTGSPYTDQEGNRFVCTITDIEVNGVEAGFDMRLYLRGEADVLSTLGSGQRISGTGHVFCPESSTNPHEFDFGDSLWNDGLGGYISVNYSAVQIEGSPGGISHALYTARNWVSQRIDEAFPNSAELVKALVIGDRRDMNDDIREDFSIAGVAHLLAISGLHVTLVASFISGILKRIIGVWPSAILTVICVFAYGALVGFSPSITRAAIMFLVLSAAPAFGRSQDGTTRLALAFIIILLINPLNIADPGFVLSFSASAGLIWLGKPAERLFGLHRILRRNTLINRLLRYVISLFCATLCAQIATYPALAMFYGTFSVVSVFSNIILVPLCLVSLIASYIGIALPAVAFIPDAMLQLLTRIVRICASVSWAEVPVYEPQPWLWLGMLAVCLLVSEISVLPLKLKPWLLPALPVLIVLSIIFTTVPGMTIVFLDVGQADCAVVQIDDYTCVIDLGEDGEEAINYINGENLTVDALFLSHPHSDHAGGLGEFAKECKIEMIYIPEGWFDELEGDGLTGEWERVVADGTDYTALAPGDSLELPGGATIDILDCAVKTGDSGNDISLIMLLEYGSNQVLFTGDACMGRTPDIDILKVGHHGSKDATTAEFLESATPKAAIISAGKNNKYGHPNSEVLDLLEEYGADIYRTDESGAITVYLDRDGDYDIVTFMEDSQ